MSPLADDDWRFRTPCHERSHRAQYDEAGWCFGATWIFDAARKLQSVFVFYFYRHGRHNAGASFLEWFRRSAAGMTMAASDGVLVAPTGFRGVVNGLWALSEGGRFSADRVCFHPFQTVDSSLFHTFP